MVGQPAFQNPALPGERVVTWSPSLTLVPSRGCFNACGYCSFRLPLRGGDPFSGGCDPQQAVTLLKRSPLASEVLVLSGEVPPDSPLRPAWFARLKQFCLLALAAGRLPHTNAGPLSPLEMADLGRLNGSLGLMLEGLGAAYERQHQLAPSKRLEIRLGQIEQAGRLGLPFTTGLLLGLGESFADRREALELLAHLQRRWGHLQEVILQPWRPAIGPGPLGSAAQRDLLRTIALARSILPAEVHLQLPPNLWPLTALPQALSAGIDDLGGIDSVDVINPRYSQPGPGQLADQLARSGWRLQPRLCVHPQWIDWLAAPLRQRADVLQASLLASRPAQTLRDP